jgi:hypothetical protein
MASARNPLSPAARLLIGSAAPTQARIAQLASVSLSQVSRSLAGLAPLRPEVLAVIRSVCGPVVADQVAALAAEARARRRRPDRGGPRAG